MQSIVGCGNQLIQIKETGIQKQIHFQYNELQHLIDFMKSRYLCLNTSHSVKCMTIFDSCLLTTQKVTGKSHKINIFYIRVINSVVIQMIFLKILFNVTILTSYLRSLFPGLGYTGPNVSSYNSTKKSQNTRRSTGHTLLQYL